MGPFKKHHTIFIESEEGDLIEMNLKNITRLSPIIKDLLGLKPGPEIPTYSSGFTFADYAKNDEIFNILNKDNKQLDHLNNVYGEHLLSNVLDEPHFNNLHNQISSENLLQIPLINNQYELNTVCPQNSKATSVSQDCADNELSERNIYNKLDNCYTVNKTDHSYISNGSTNIYNNNFSQNYFDQHQENYTDNNIPLNYLDKGSTYDILNIETPQNNINTTDLQNNLINTNTWNNNNLNILQNYSGQIDAINYMDTKNCALNDFYTTNDSDNMHYGNTINNNNSFKNVVNDVNNYNSLNQNSLTNVSNFTDENVIPMKNISSSTLKKISTWVDKHCEDLDTKINYYLPQDDNELKKYTFSEWETKFFTMDNLSLYNLVTASDYLDIKFLTESCCIAIANMINGKNPDQIREAFNIINDLANHESNEVENENEWDELFQNL